MNKQRLFPHTGFTERGFTDKTDNLYSTAQTYSLYSRVIQVNLRLQTVTIKSKNPTTKKKGINLGAFPPSIHLHFQFLNTNF